MRYLKLLFLLFFVSSVCAKLPSLIPRKILLGNYAITNVLISPQGKNISYLAPSKENIVNVWIQDIRRINPPKMMTHDVHRNIRYYCWTEDGHYLLYLQDQNGDENYHLYKVNIKNRKVIDLTPYKNITIRNILTNRHYPMQILVSMNLNDKRLFDVYRINLKTNKAALDTKNLGHVETWYADGCFKIRAALTAEEDGSSNLLVRKSNRAAWYRIVHWPFGDYGSAVMFSRKGRFLYVESSLDSDTSRLIEIKVNNGKMQKVLASSHSSDIDSILKDEESGQIDAVGFNYKKPYWVVLNPVFDKDFQTLSKTFSGASFHITSWDRARRYWVIVFQKDTMPPVYYLYDHRKHCVTKLFEAQVALQKYQFSQMRPIVIHARDGVQLVSYLTLPVGISHTRVPLVLLVHGGPWARDDWGFNPVVQWLANRGYAVLQVNYRGSMGFGKTHVNRAIGQWGVGDMQHDLTDAVQWAVAQKIADQHRVCIYGGSYGGYAVLSGLVFTPSLYRCGVDIVGPSELKLLMQSIPPYWYIGRRFMELHIGDVLNNDVLNEKISPLYHIENIRAPLLIAQGKYDPRVSIEHSNRIVQAMRAKKLDVEYLVYTNEGHGFNQAENRMDFYGRAEQFLAKYLRGRSEPFEKVSGAQVQVK